MVARPDAQPSHEQGVSTVTPPTIRGRLRFLTQPWFIGLALGVAAGLAIGEHTIIQYQQLHPTFEPGVGERILGDLGMSFVYGTLGIVLGGSVD